MKRRVKLGGQLISLIFFWKSHIWNFCFFEFIFLLRAVTLTRIPTHTLTPSSIHPSYTIGLPVEDSRSGGHEHWSGL